MSRPNYPVFSVPSLEAFLARLTPEIEAVEHRWLIETVGLLEKNAQQLQAGLCVLGFMEPSGRLTDEGKLLASSGARAALFGRVCERVYVEMLGTLLQHDEFHTDHVHQFLSERGIKNMGERQKTAMVFKFLVLNSDRDDVIRRYSMKK